MAIPVSDVPSNANEQLDHAVEVIKKSKYRTALFKAVYFGTKRIKTASDLAPILEKMGATKALARKRVLEYMRALVGNSIVEQTKNEKDGEIAYKMIEFFKTRKAQILNLVGNPIKLSKLPTKRRPVSNATGGSVFNFKIVGKQVKIKEISYSDINFGKKLSNKPTSRNLSKVAESTIKNGFAKVFKQKSSQKDWGGEKNDLYILVKLGKKNYRCAIAFKGRATQGKLMPKQMGKNADQIQRLFNSSAQVLLIVYHGEIDQAINEQMEKFAIACSYLRGDVIYYGVIDGAALSKIVATFPKAFSV